MLLSVFNRFFNERYLGCYLLVFYKQNKET